MFFVLVIALSFAQVPLHPSQSLSDPISASFHWPIHPERIQRWVDHSVVDLRIMGQTHERRVALDGDLISAARVAGHRDHPDFLKYVAALTEAYENYPVDAPQIPKKYDAESRLEVVSHGVVFEAFVAVCLQRITQASQEQGKDVRELLPSIGQVSDAIDSPDLNSPESQVVLSALQEAYIELGLLFSIEHLIP